MKTRKLSIVPGLIFKVGIKIYCVLRVCDSKNITCVLVDDNFTPKTKNVAKFTGVKIGYRVNLFGSCIIIKDFVVPDDLAGGWDASKNVVVKTKIGDDVKIVEVDSKIPKNISKTVVKPISVITTLKKMLTRYSKKIIVTFNTITHYMITDGELADFLGVLFISSDKISIGDEIVNINNAMITISVSDTDTDAYIKKMDEIREKFPRYTSCINVELWKYGKQVS